MGFFSDAKFILSIDLELMWGLINTQNRDVINRILRAGGTGVRNCINLLIKFLETYDIEATWAIVGHLFLDKSVNNIIQYINIPILKNCFLKKSYINLFDNSLFYGRDIIETILSNPIQHEIGYHSFSHVIFSKCNKEVAEKEIKEGVKIAKKFGIKLSSFVFPQNKVGHLDVLKKYGFKAFRGKSLERHNMEHNILLKLAEKTIDRIITPIDRSINKPKKIAEMWEIPFNMTFYDPHMPWSLYPRTKIWLKRTINSKEIFHISLHPWNLLIYKSLKRDLEKFLVYLSKQRDKGLIDIMTMGKFADLLEGKMHE